MTRGRIGAAAQWVSDMVRSKNIPNKDYQVQTKMLHLSIQVNINSDGLLELFVGKGRAQGQFDFTTILASCLSHPRY